jgi:hypothetical protein
MEFDEVSKKAAAAIGEAEKVAPIGMFCQLLHQLNAALTRPKQWPMVAREAAFTASEIGTLNFVNWLRNIQRCQEPIRKAFRLSSEFVATHHIVVEDHRFLVYKLLYELQGISTTLRHSPLSRASNALLSCLYGSASSWQEQRLQTRRRNYLIESYEPSSIFSSIRG